MQNGEPGYWEITSNHYSSRSNARFVEDYVGQRDNPNTLPSSFEDDSWRDIVRPSQLTRNLSGLALSQEKMIAGDNSEEEGSYILYSAPCSQYTDELVRRSLMGEVSLYADEGDGMNPMYDRNFLHLHPKEKFFRRMTNGGDDPNRFDNQMFYALKFPESHLLKELENKEIENVTVSPMSNGREQGLVYTVREPNGDTRSFSVYEHRNTDSIVINCGTNFEPTFDGRSAGPRPKMKDDRDSKWDFVAEFAYGTNPKVVAETLSFFLKEAQNGELDDDDTLVRKCERLDWNAIISRQVPVFSEWLKVQEEKEMEIIFKRIEEEDDFDKWSRELGG